jgi:hypothetical protein
MKNSAYYIKSVFLFFFLWIVCYAAILAPFGVDFTDEGLYLFEASNLKAVWGVPYGRILHYIFAFCGYDVGYYRALSFSILVMLHFLIFKELIRSSNYIIQKNIVWFIFYLIIFCFSFLFFNGLFIRTPGYNYINYLSIVLFVFAVLRWRNQLRLDNYYPELMLFLSLAVSTTSKPTTTILMLVVLVVLYFRGYIHLTKKSYNKHTVLAIIGALIIFLITYPACFYLFDYVFIRKENNVVFLESQTFSVGILKSALSYGKSIIENKIYGFNTLCIILVSLGIILLLKLVFNKNPIMKFLAIVGMIFFVGIIFIRSPHFNVLVNVIFWLGVMSHFYLKKHLKVQYLMVLIIPLAYVVGTGNNYIVMVTHTFPLIFTLWLGYNVRIVDSNKLTLTTLIVSGLLVYSFTIFRPYRTDNLANCNAKVIELTHGTNIYIPKGTASQVEAIKTALINNGWTPGNEMLCLNYRWSSTLPYFLGANTGNAAMITIFGYQKSIDVGLTKLRRSGLTKNAWIMYNSKVFDSDENLNSTWRTVDTVEVVNKSASYNDERDTLLTAFYTMNNINKKSYVRVFDNFGYVILKPKNNKHKL